MESILYNMLVQNLPCVHISCESCYFHSQTIHCPIMPCGSRLLRTFLYWFAVNSLHRDKWTQTMPNIQACAIPTLMVMNMVSMFFPPLNIVMRGFSSAALLFLTLLAGHLQSDWSCSPLTLSVILKKSSFSVCFFSVSLMHNSFHSLSLTSECRCTYVSPLIHSGF